MEDTKIRQDLAGIAKDILRQSYIPKLRAKKNPFKPLCEETACNLFKAYFNNKMTIFLFLIQKKRPEPDSLSALKAVIFFDDLYHHMLKSEYQKDYHRIFQWLKLFFKRFPYVKPIQKRKAIEYIKVIYRLFGLQFKLNI